MLFAISCCGVQILLIPALHDQVHWQKDNKEVSHTLHNKVLLYNNHQEKTVIYTSPKPQDFERSEQIVIIGNIQNDIFRADKILMKCPSKYEDKELKENISVNSKI